MSMDPGTMQALLAKQLSQGPATATQGGMQSHTSPLNAAATVAQKALLMHALYKAQQQQQMQGQATAQMPGSQAQMQNDPTMQAMQSPQASPNVLTADQLQALQAAVNPAAAPQMPADPDDGQ